MSDHYATLGVSRDADEAAIRTAFRKKASAAHPDKNGGDGRAMAELNRANDVLGDPARKEHYDRTGQDRPGADPEAQAKQVLQQLFDAYLSDEREWSGNLVEKFRLMLEQKISEVTSGKMKADLAIRRLERTKGRIAGSDLYRTLAEQRLGHYRQQSAVADDQIVMLKRAREMLNACTDTAPVEPPAGGWTQGSGVASVFTQYGNPSHGGYGQWNQQTR